jgi:LuxR family maltose regulon positive regulatory protein
MEEPAQTGPLLRTKLFVPAPRNDTIQRPRLIHTLQTGLKAGETFNRKLTLISAPAGYGKTTLASQWIAETGISAAWLSLETGENDITRFLTYLVAALRCVSPEIGGSTLGMLQAPQRPPPEILLTALINELTAYHGSLLLVLDDYHVIRSHPIHEILNFLVEHLPPNVHLIITSREDPPLPLYRLLARREMLGIRQAELSFTVDEVGAFFRTLSGLDLTEDQVARLTRRTEGWVTGIQLAALSLKHSVDRDDFINSFTGSNRFILDYLFEEVFKIQSEEMKSFLLQTSVLERMCANLADAVTDEKGSRVLLEQLVHANFFIVPLDATGEWYRYHRLFSDLLRHRLEGAGIDRTTLHDRAGWWFADHDYLDDAIEHALQGALWDSACHWIAKAGDRCLRRGEIITLLSWWQRVPERVVLGEADWALSYAWSLILGGDLETAERILKSTKELPSSQEMKIKGEIASAEAYISRGRGDTGRTIELSKQALALLPEDDRGNRGTIALNLGLITWHLGQLDDAEIALREALEDTRATNNHYGYQTALLFTARTAGARAQLDEALRYLELALDIGDHVPTAVLVHTDLAAIAFERDHLEMAWEHLAHAEAIAEATHSTEFLTAWAIQRALFHLGLNQVGKAAEALKPALVILNTGQLSPTTKARIIACQVQIVLAAGDIGTASRLLETMPLPHDAQTFFRFIDLNTARLQLAAHEPSRACATLRESQERAEAAGWSYALLAIRILQSLAAEDTEQALACLEPALLQAENQGFLRIFLSEGDRMLALLKHAAQRGIAPAQINRILAAASPSETEASAASTLVEPLTERELEVLRLLAAGLSNREIAEQLVVSLGTAKAHIHHIFGKLDVSSRIQAASRGRELGLL